MIKKPADVRPTPFDISTKPYRPAEPNMLLFYEVTVHNNQLHYWALKDSSGIQLAESAHNYMTKLDAIRNCIMVFGRDLQEGNHLAIDDRDQQDIHKELNRLVTNDLYLETVPNDNDD